MAKLIAILIVLELIEAYWQYSKDLEGVLQKCYALYRRSVFLLLGMHLGYLFLLYVSVAYGVFNWPMAIAIGLKSMDIFVKIDLIERLYVKKTGDDALRMLLGAATSPWLYLIGVATYPYLLYWALQP